jgi:hypothetical protein
MHLWPCVCASGLSQVSKGVWPCVCVPKWVRGVVFVCLRVGNG